MAQVDAEPHRNGLIYRVGRRWEQAKDYWDILRPMRFCVLVLFGISILIVFIPQSQDALLALFEDAFTGSSAGIANLIAFAVLAWLWAFQTFYWSRFVSRLPARERRPIFYKPPLLDHGLIERRNRLIPRWLGGLVLVFVWIALARASWPDILREITLSVLMIIIAAVYSGAVVYRRDIVRRLKYCMPIHSRDLVNIRLDKRIKKIALALAIVTLTIFTVSGFVDLPRFLGLAISIVWVAFALVAPVGINGINKGTLVILYVNIVVFGALFLASVDRGMPVVGWFSGLPSAPIIMSVAAAWVFTGTFFLAVPGEVLRLPITTLVAVFAVVSSFIGCSDNHVLRVAGQLPPRGTSIEEAFAKWWGQWGNPTEPVPLVLVATAGGASRAAYWTAKLLSQIEQDHPGFHKHVFAISSVSGGSLGAVVYRTMLNDVIGDDDPKGDWRCPDENAKATKKNLVHCGLKVIDHDFLGPTFLTGLYADLTQRLLPGSLLPDRAGALEGSWEAAWRATLPGSSKGVGLDAPFHSLWNAKPWLPALIINGTSEKTGRRIITSNLVIDPDRFTDAVDFFAKASPSADIPVSTAAHNSARFPYIDAPGTLITAKSGMTDRIVDGGYFENFGAGSIYDLLYILNSQEIKGDKKIRFFILQIISDPTLSTRQARRDEMWEESSPFKLNVAADVTAPPISLFNTGGALGFRATEVLKGAVEELRKDGLPHYARFELTDKNETLSWVLSRKSIKSLNDEWDRNDQSYCDLRKFMGWTEARCSN